MAAPGENQYAVHLEWLDPHSQLLRPFHLKFFEVDDTLEIYDTRQHRMFLKRVAPPEGVRAKDLYVGNTVTVFSRKMKVTAYADDRTRRFFEAARSKALAIVMPRMVRRIGDLLQGMQDAGLECGQVRMLRFSPEEAASFVALSRSREDSGALSAGPVVAVELVATDCLATAAALSRSAPGLRVSPSAACVDAEIAYCFDPVRSGTALHRDCSVCVIRPYAVAEGKAGAIVRAIQAAGFTISAMESVQFAGTDAADFLDAYKGVLPEFGEWVRDLESGPTLTMELVGEDVAAKFREFCGPYNPEIAKILRPDTLRAKFGDSAVQNAVHCTDLPTDGPLESKFVFHVIQNS